jgi:hypothetical protein
VPKDSESSRTESTGTIYDTVQKHSDGLITIAYAEPTRERLLASGVANTDAMKRYGDWALLCLPAFETSES